MGYHVLTVGARCSTDEQDLTAPYEALLAVVVRLAVACLETTWGPTKSSECRVSNRVLIAALTVCQKKTFGGHLPRQRSSP